LTVNFFLTIKKKEGTIISLDFNQL